MRDARSFFFWRINHRILNDGSSKSYASNRYFNAFIR
jgi:hypothetical protein